jgi:hypothetical protein
MERASIGINAIERNSMFKKYALILTLMVTVASCDSTIEDASSKRAKTNVSYEDKNGLVTAQAKADADNTIVASGDSDSAGSYVDLPAGALAVDMELLMGDAEDESDAALTALGIDSGSNAIVSKSAPLYVNTESDDVKLAKPMTVVLPIPKKDGFTLMASAKLVFIYIIYTTDGYKAGIKALTAENLVGTFVTAEFEGLGYFQIAYFAKEVEETEVDYTRPELKN